MSDKQDLILMNILRRLPLPRLLLLCGLILALGVSLTALALGLNTGPVPAPKPLADAIHDALVTPPVEGVSANIQLTDHLLEGANLTSGGGEASQLTSSPLISGASGRLWISKEGHVRLELQSEKGDTEIYYDGHTVQMYDPSSNTLYRYTVPEHEQADSADAARGSIHFFGKASTPGEKKALEHEIAVLGARAHSGHGSDSLGAAQPEVQRDQTHEPPTVAKIEEAITHAKKHADVSAATPTDVAGQAAYTVRITPNEAGSLLGGAELSWDAVHGVPLRAAVYSTESSSPALELAASSISYGPVESSVFEFTPPAGAKIENVSLPEHEDTQLGSTGSHEHPKVTTQGHGPSTIAVLESKTKAGMGAKETSPALPEGLQQVKINGTVATELPTELGTLLSFERSGVRYLLAGSVGPAALETVAKGL